ncbi:hypothetical protein OTU49_007236, partial [Cherax quadricarinatus]
MQLRALLSLLTLGSVACEFGHKSSATGGPAKQLASDVAEITNSEGKGSASFMHKTSVKGVVHERNPATSGSAQFLMLNPFYVPMTPTATASPSVSTPPINPRSARQLDKRLTNDGNTSSYISSSFNIRDGRKFKRQITQLKKMKCKPHFRKVYVRDVLAESSDHLDKRLFPQVVAVKRCCASCSYCGNNVG